VDISITVFCVFVRLRISPPRIKLAASNIARWFVGVLGRKSPILGNFAAPPEAQNRTNRLRRLRWGAMTRACTRAMHSIGMCGYLAIPKMGVVFLCVCMVTNFSTDDKASGVQFCTVVHRRPGAGNLLFWGTLLPQKPKIG